MNKKLLLIFIFGILSMAAMAQSKDEKAVRERIETWRVALINQNAAALYSLLAEEMTYGHSNGQMDTKVSFINTIDSRKEVYQELELTKMNITMVGNTALVRHQMDAKVKMEDGSTITPKLGVLQVWQKGKDGWQLLARQAFKL
ncbi:nuclear transport factor 2 family protein [Arundinibacter roseus]|uniref:Nuclear transport factor 2 family protein n=1 Tax=Arundinibacter roseus TaxID=2070510 RepID=A0A4R4KBJ0_9BACT|nr:nuclear transport factor 2 family protein [Arundinibacter roseus]TDB65257.1 nuclear transport factor 2 family protein [Arundinibacter roseus]